MTSGEWLAPYTGIVVTDPCKLDIAHMVPLGNAHASGAWICPPTNGNGMPITSAISNA